MKYVNLPRALEHAAFIVDFPIEHGDLNHSCVNVYQRVCCVCCLFRVAVDIQVACLSARCEPAGAGIYESPDLPEQISKTQVMSIPD